MVRVISVHHFTNQNIQTVEQPTACTVAPPNRLLLALTSNCIEVRDIKNDSEVMFSFPTVDEVVHIVHCLNGDYVATMETKFNRQNRETNFVRVYVNWDTVATLQQSKMTSSGVSLGSSECGMVQPMRARIAGRVTPTTNQSELGSLEMIEIPVRKNPNSIDCCQISGNLAILAGNSINLYKFEVKTHDISKLRFIDFEEVQILIELSFDALNIEISENYLGCMSRDCFHLFRVRLKVDREAETPEFNFRCLDDGPVDYQALSKEKITVNLPTILRDNSIIHKNNPFTYSDKEMVAKVTKGYLIEDLIQLRLIPILIESGAKSVTEEFKSMVLKPLYIEESLNKPKDGAFLCSDFHASLNSVVCMVATQQEGYLYCFDDFNGGENQDNCVAIYPFTAPVFKIVMEDYFLHALTETGLESYTLRFGHKLCRNFEVMDDINVSCPPISDSICLVGLRPFLGVERILLSEENLLLLANSDSSPTHSVGSNSSSNAIYWTLYNLELPSPKTTFNDISIVANVHRFTSTQTYCHLMSEAHIILRVALLLKKWTYTEDSVKLIIQDKSKIEDLIETYRTSCALLGDHFIMSMDDHKLAIPYYKMARISPPEVLKRVKKIQEQSNLTSKGLLHYLKHTLLDTKTIQLTSQFTETILDLLQTDLPTLILKSRIIREYSTDKLIKILTKQEITNEAQLALTILQIQKCNPKKALENLSRIPNATLFELLLENWDLLLDFNNAPKSLTTFSELSTLLITFYPELLSSILVTLIVDKKLLTLNKLIKIFLEYLPSSIGNDGNTVLLQRTLEQYFDNYFSRPENADLSKITYERGSSEAMKLLVRSYLSQLQILQLKTQKTQNFEPDESPPPQTICYKKLDKIQFPEEIKKPKDTYLFSNIRYEYLDKMPPFPSSENPDADSILRRLQALLCSQTVPKQVLGEVAVFLRVNDDLRGAESLRSIILGTNDAVQLLIDVCPQCLPQFAKDRFTKRDEWKYLIATVQRRILKLSQKENSSKICFFHKKILKDILTHVATNMTLEHLVEVFPQRFSTTISTESDNRKNESDEKDLSDDLDILNEIQNYEPYVIICKETMHANQINKLITTTGQQLLCTLSL